MNVMFGDVERTHPLLIKLPGPQPAVEITNIAADYVPSTGDRVYLIELAPAQWLVAGAYVRSRERGS